MPSAGPSPFVKSLRRGPRAQGFAPKALKMGVGGAVGMAAYEVLPYLCPYHVHLL